MGISGTAQIAKAASIRLAAVKTDVKVLFELSMPGPLGRRQQLLL